MRPVRACLLAVVLAATTCRAGEVPRPLFWDSEADFLAQVGEGQFIDRLELHLVQYASDPRWRSEWAAERYAGSGLFGEYGSTTGSELYVNSAIALNIFPLERFQLRYDRREYQDGRFDISDERFDALWYAGAGWALVLSGWPAFDKEDASLGIGLRLGVPRSRNALELRVINDNVVWNLKTDTDAQLTRRPLRILVDGFLESGPWQVVGTLSYGLPYEASESAAGSASAGRQTRGLQRFADLELGYSAAGWSAGLRLTGAVLERSQSEPVGAPLVLDRSWGRALATFRKPIGRWEVSGLLGWAAQRDEFSSPSEPSGSYALDAVLFGLEGGWQVSRGLTLRLGYLGNPQDAVRSASPSGPVPSMTDDAFIDKAHLRAIYSFRPRMSIELLLSQAIHGGSFGGGSVKALLVF